MSFNIEEISPRNPVLIVDGAEIHLMALTLRADVSLKYKYGTLVKVYDSIKENPSELLDIIWFFVKDKKLYNDKPENFKNYLFKARESITDIAQKIKACLDEAVNTSMPLIKNKKRYKELQAINDSQTDETPCFLEYFDSISKRYGYTLDSFMDLTLRQVHMLLNLVGDKSYEELEVQAALQGRKLKPRMKFLDVSEEEEMDQEQQALDALKRLQEDYKAKQNKEL